MKKSMLFAAAAVVAMVGCTNEDFTGFQQSQNGEAAINFGSGTKKITRGGQLTGDKAAEKLGNNFVVLGYKGSKTPDYATLVFDYYDVNYKASSAGSTESNSKDWEYVGQGVNALATSISAQTIKYWDFAVDQYDFIAFSKGTNEKTIDQLFTTVDKTALGTSNKAYSVAGTLKELKNCYIADLVTVYSPDLSISDQPTFASGAVTPVFRSLQAKLRLGFYETVPGYSVKEVKFYEDGNAATSGTTPYLYTADGEGTLAVGDDAEGEMVISFPTVGSGKVANEDYNQAHIAFSTLSSTDALKNNVPFAAFGEKSNQAAKQLDEKTSGNVFLGRSSSSATYAGDLTSDNAYVAVLPTGKGNTLTLKVDYILESIDGTGEEIKVTGATAQIPAIYTEWQPNYAYTYLFKISDQTNGLTDPSQTGYAGLYPITFDAIVEGDIDGIQETITEVGEPSITTYQKGKVVTENDEYKAGTDPIYITVNNGEELTEDFYKKGATNIFEATFAEEGACQTLSEKSVANCVNHNNGAVYDPSVTPASTTYTVTDYNDKTLTLTPTTDTWSLETEIAQKDAPHGVAINTDGAKTCVAKIEQPAAKTYVFQYLLTPVTYKDATFNTLPINTSSDPVIYYLVEKSGNVETYTKKEADGTETYKKDYYAKTTPSLSTAVTDATMAKGTNYFEKSTVSGKSVFTLKVSDGTETYTASKRYPDNSFTKIATSADVNLVDGDVYYVKEGSTNTYTEHTVGASGLTVKTTDPFYMATTDYKALTDEIEDDEYNTVKPGQTYYTLATVDDVTTLTKIVTVGNEATNDASSAPRYYTGLTAATYYAETAFNTVAAGTAYFTPATATAAPVKNTATGDETTLSGQVVDKMPTYYYKVIKVQ